MGHYDSCAHGDAPPGFIAKKVFPRRGGKITFKRIESYRPRDLKKIMDRLVIDDVHVDAIEVYLKSVRRTAKVTTTNLNYYLCGLGGEVGEVLNQWQKHLRGDDGRKNQLTAKSLKPKRRAKILAELGGVFWYLFAACDSLGVSPKEIMRANAAELASRAARGTIKGDGDDR